MSKKKSRKVAKQKSAKLEATTTEVEQPAAQKPAADEGETRTGKYIIRAIRVTQEMLDAAKEYKKVSGVSFYRLGEECITERLVKEGYLKATETKA